MQVTKQLKYAPGFELTRFDVDGVQSSLSGNERNQCLRNVELNRTTSDSGVISSKKSPFR